MLRESLDGSARNAILVRATPAQSDQLRGIPGVVRVRPVDTLHPPKTTR